MKYYMIAVSNKGTAEYISGEGYELDNTPKDELDRMVLAVHDDLLEKHYILRGDPTLVETYLVDDDTSLDMIHADGIRQYYAVSCNYYVTNEHQVIVAD